MYCMTKITKSSVLLFHSTFLALNFKISWNFGHISICKQLWRTHILGKSLFFLILNKGDKRNVLCSTHLIALLTWWCFLWRHLIWKSVWNCTFPRYWTKSYFYGIQLILLWLGLLICLRWGSFQIVICSNGLLLAFRCLLVWQLLLEVVLSTLNHL